MKSFHSLTEQFKKWRQKYQHRCSIFLSGEIEALRALILEKRAGRKFNSPNSPLMLAMAVTSLTSIVGYRFYNYPHLSVGTISPTTIVAPRDGSFEDLKTTEEKRKAVRTGIVPVLKHDENLSGQIDREIEEVLSIVEKYRRIAGSFPFVDVKILSLKSQEYLRKCQECEWKTLQALVNPESAPNQKQQFGTQSPRIAVEPSIGQAIAQLQTARSRLSRAQFESLVDRIYSARQQYRRASVEFFAEKTIEASALEKAALLDLGDETWDRIKKAIAVAKKRMLVQGIPPGMPRHLLEDTIAIQLDSLPPRAMLPAANLLVGVLDEKYNLIQDNEETKTRAERAVLKVKPAIVEIAKGEAIVEAGEKITREDFVLLDGFGLSRRRPNWDGLGLSVFLVTAGVLGFWVVEKRVHRPMRCRDRILLCLMSASAPMLAIFQIPYTNLSAIGLLTSSFYGSSLALTQVLLLAGLMTFCTGTFGWEYLLAGTAGGIVAAIMASRLRSREELALLGGVVGLIQGGVYLIVNLILSTAAGSIWYAVLPGTIVYGLSGLAWSIVALGLSPYLESLFDLVTPIRLAELSNPNRLLLKRLATEAPGTFQHTMFVASLAEAAARELHCNVELVRAGTLYHDIGKMHDPLGFIENQMGGPNKHDEINDPWESAGIIKKHVSEGIALARKYGLPEAVRNFIPEHQGKLLISYFYIQAKQRVEEIGGSLEESDFRYDGPVPQSRETAIVMLADGCEAALRSLKDVTPETALVTVNKIFKARWQDRQLGDSGLEREELAIIAEVFVRVWQQYNHKRIVYPKAALEIEKSSK